MTRMRHAVAQLRSSTCRSTASILRSTSSGVTGNVAVVLAFAGRRHGAEDASPSRRDCVDQHGQRRIGQQRIAGAHRVDHPLDEAVDHEEAVERLVVARCWQVSTPRSPSLRISVLQSAASYSARRQRPDAGILVGEREARLALVRRDQVEALELGDVAPAAGDLAVGDLEHAVRDRRDQRRDGAPVEDAVAEIAEDHRVGRALLHRVDERLQDVVGDRAVVERVDLQQAVAADDDRVLVGRRPRAVDDRTDIDAVRLQLRRARSP